MNNCWTKTPYSVRNETPMQNGSIFYACSCKGEKWPIHCQPRPFLASYPGHVGGGKSGLVSTVCACAKNPMISWGIVYHRLRTVNLYRIGPKHVRLELIPQTAGKKSKATWPGYEARPFYNHLNSHDVQHHIIYGATHHGCYITIIYILYKPTHLLLLHPFC